MPSRLRQFTSIEDTDAITVVRSSASPPPSKKQKMSLSQTYFIASSARSKLGKEAMRPDHNLRLLVGHANLLDALMIELRDAEREQEAWFNASVKKAQKEEEPKHIRWADTIVEEEDDDSEDSDSDSDFDEDDFEMAIPRNIMQSPVTISSRELDEDEEEMGYEDLEDNDDLALTRTSSHPPELVHDSDSEDDSSPPTTPPQAVLEFSEKDIIELTMSKQQPFIQAGDYIMHERETPLIQAY
ncbi:hypothetical protein BT63DRAFT_110850 [Microthyrium microscopicum]|uniref:Uncharacterized protein n=1 Tax=Microthyrium microscopicum TaxID=703497 RepID=A0A6A6TW76_9PEZI|nr:hypothetical protein BT63DRAFT_110850 [Microthyrium microscopicum]